MAVKPEKTKYPGVTYIEVARPNGGTEKSFYVTYRDPSTGKLKNVSVGRSVRNDMTAARAAGIRADLIEGTAKTKKQKAEEEAAKLTIRKLWEEYDALHTERKAATNNKYLAKFFDHLMPLTPEQLTTGKLEDLRRRLETEGKSPQTIKHVLSLLQRIIRSAAKRGRCELPRNLFFPMPELDNKVTECLTPQQIKKLLEVLSKEPERALAGMMKLALYTGMRKGALLALQWDDLDFEKGFITLRGESAKSKKTSQIPMSDVARQVLNDIPRTAGSPFLFPGRDGEQRTTAQRFIERIAKAAELPKGFRPMHGLRHTYASLLASSGQVDLYTLQKLLTHHSPLMTQRYSHLADEALQRAASVGTGIFSAIGQAEPESVAAISPEVRRTKGPEAEPTQLPKRAAQPKASQEMRRTK